MNHPILNLIKKPDRLVVGIMSGTSADGVDVSLCRISGHGTDTEVEQIDFCFVPFDEAVRSEILRIAGGKSAAAEDFCKMNFLLGELYVDAVRKLCSQAGVNPENIDLIGSHGQTLWHIPKEEEYLGYRFKSTFQLGECAVLSEAFGCPVVGDFRVRDVAAGGLGAPLVPYSEFLIYRRKTECIALQNIGGIGNITCLLPDCSLEDVFAFDTGPGNMVIDAVYSAVTNGRCRYDEGGKYAAQGRVSEKLLAYMMDDEYIHIKPPKTTGREYYGEQYVNRIMVKARELGVNNCDLMATVTAFTAETIKYGVRHFMSKKPDRLIVGGGGSMNKTLMRFIAEALPDCGVMTNEQLGYDSNAKEAVAFAVLANETIFSGANNVPTVTGANKYVVMGKISL